MSVFLLLNMYYFNPFSVMSSKMALMVFMIVPLYSMLYTFFGLWMVLRFNYTNILKIIIQIFMIPFLLVGWLSGSLIAGSGSTFNEVFYFLGGGVNIENRISLLTPLTLFFAVLGLFVGFVIMFVIMKRFNKERIVVLL